MTKLYFFLVFLFLSTFSHTRAQIASYRGAENKHYWKNRPPYQGYWQQDVHYEITARLDEKENTILGESFSLTYWNNSPHILNELYFHLFQEAFQPGSYYHQLWLDNQLTPKFGDKYESKGLGTKIQDFKINGREAEIIFDNTLFKVSLAEPLKPGDSLIATCSFVTYFDQGNMRRRMKMFESYGEKVFNGVHWYPSICVYDQKFGWTKEQHLDKEFYHNYGSFDVKLRLPAHYITDATGVLQNREEALPDSLMKLLDFRNFANKKLKSPPSVILPGSNEVKTWHFFAMNVHNFVFTASPLYRIGEMAVKLADGSEVLAKVLVQEPNAPGWQITLPYLARLLQFCSEDFGIYAWPKLVIADANDGMEYSMMAFCNGEWPAHQSLIAHEGGHMWYYGMVGSNETYRPYMDEGFTQFLTVYFLDRMTGHKTTPLPRELQKQFIEPVSQRFAQVYLQYYKSLEKDEDRHLNTHSSDFNASVRQAGGYGMVYFKTAVMLYNLQYVLGDSLFHSAMLHYFNQWKFCHPYPEDFRNSIASFTQVDLNWFFDQWLETTKKLDFGLRSVTPAGSKWVIELVRKQEMQSPIDLKVTCADGQIHYFHIPNTWFVKKTEAKVLAKWYGWGKFNAKYRAEIELPSKPVKVEIDPTFRLADIVQKDNVWRNKK